MTTRLKWVARLLTFAVVWFIVGFVSFWFYYRGPIWDRFVDSFYGAVGMFIGAFEPATDNGVAVDPNLWLEFVQLVALLFSLASVLLLGIAAARALVDLLVFRWRRGHIVVIGSTVLAERLAISLRQRRRDRFRVAHVRLVDAGSGMRDDGIEQRLDLDEVNLGRLANDLQQVVGGADEVYLCVGDDMLTHQIIGILRGVPLGNGDKIARVRAAFEDIETAGAYACGLYESHATTGAARPFLLDAFGLIDRVVAERVLGPVVPGDQSSGGDSGRSTAEEASCREARGGSVRQVLVVGSGRIAVSTAIRAADAFGVVDSAEVICIGPDADEVAGQVEHRRRWVNLTAEPTQADPVAIAAAVRRSLTGETRARPEGSPAISLRESLVVVCDEYDARAVAHAAAIARAGVPRGGDQTVGDVPGVVLVLSRSAMPEEDLRVPTLPGRVSDSIEVKVVSIEDALCGSGTDRLNRLVPNAMLMNPLVSAARWALCWGRSNERLEEATGAADLRAALDHLVKPLPSRPDTGSGESAQHRSPLDLMVDPDALGWGAVEPEAICGYVGESEAWEVLRSVKLVGWGMSLIGEICGIEFVAGAEPVVLLPDDLSLIRDRIEADLEGLNTPGVEVLADDELFWLMRWITRLPVWLARAGLGSVRLGGRVDSFDPAFIDRVAEQVHVSYLGLEASQGVVRSPTETPGPSTSNEWDDLHELFRTSNRDAVWMLPLYVMWLECTLEAPDPASLWRVDTSCLSRGSPELEFMAEREHERWTEERLASGWKQAEPGGERNNHVRVHTTMVPWQDLSEENRNKDRANITSLSGVLAGSFHLHLRVPEFLNVDRVDENVVTELLGHPLVLRLHRLNGSVIVARRIRVSREAAGSRVSLGNGVELPFSEKEISAEFVLMGEYVDEERRLVEATTVQATRVQALEERVRGGELTPVRYPVDSGVPNLSLPSGFLSRLLVVGRDLLGG